ncbi:MAG: acyltransferase family protein [Woeseiaceae bacterium]
MSQARRYDIDALRVFAFSLLILYHVAMFYVADWGWHIKSAYQAEWLQFPMVLVNQWRMSLLFIISGLAVSFVWQRYTPGRFALRRIYRLLLPLVFGMAFIVAPQCYYEALGKGIIEPGFGKFMLQYLTFQDFPGDAWGGEEIIGWTWNHLWYLAYVLLYSLVLIPLAVLFDGPLKRVRSGFRALRGIWIWAVPVALLMVYGTFVYPKFPYISHALIDDWYAHVMYFTFFLIGYLVGRDEGFWGELERMRWVTLVSAIVFFGLFMTRESLIPEDSFVLADKVQALIVYSNRWLWIIAIFGWGHRLLNRPSAWLSYATGAVYPWYILHQTITIVIGANLARYSLGPVVEPALVLGGTIAGCFVLYEFVIRRVRVLQPLFGVSVGR